MRPEALVPTPLKKHQEQGCEAKKTRNRIDADRHIGHDKTLLQFVSGKGVARAWLPRLLFGPCGPPRRPTWRRRSSCRSRPPTRPPWQAGPLRPPVPRVGRGAVRPAGRAVRARDGTRTEHGRLKTRAGRRNRVVPCALSCGNEGVEVRGFEPLASSVRESARVAAATCGAGRIRLVTWHDAGPMVTAVVRDSRVGCGPGAGS
jgi:hypothetical protein